MTWLDEIPLEEKEAIEALRKRTVMDCTSKMLEDPSLFYRFLKARNFNLKNAEAMLRKHILWRKEFGIDTILTDFKAPEVLQKYYSYGFIGYDKEGTPVNYVGCFKMDAKGLMKSIRIIDFHKECIFETEKDVERMFERSKKTGEIISQKNIICDMAEITFSKATNKKALETEMEWFGILQDNYPEHIKRVYVINAPSYFSTMFAIVKLAITSGLLKKIQVVETEKVKETLLKTIDADILPAFLGGNRTDPDGNPLCKTFIRHGGNVPKEYYFSKKSIQQEEDVEYLYVSRRLQVDVLVDVEDPGSALMWEFETTDKDISFGIYFKTLEGELVELVQKKRIETTWEPETGIHVCEKSGSYVLAFDNSYSWFLSKEIYYRTKIIPPTTE